MQINTLMITCTNANLNVDTFRRYESANWFCVGSDLNEDMEIIENVLKFITLLCVLKGDLKLILIIIE